MSRKGKKYVHIYKKIYQVNNKHRIGKNVNVKTKLREITKVV